MNINKISPLDYKPLASSLIEEQTQTNRNAEELSKAIVLTAGQVLSNKYQDSNLLIKGFIKICYFLFSEITRALLSAYLKNILTIAREDLINEKDGKSPLAEKLKAFLKSSALKDLAQFIQEGYAAHPDDRREALRYVLDKVGEKLPPIQASSLQDRIQIDFTSSQKCLHKLICYVAKKALPNISFQDIILDQIEDIIDTPSSSVIVVNRGEVILKHLDLFQKHLVSEKGKISVLSDEEKERFSKDAIQLIQSLLPIFKEEKLNKIAKYVAPRLIEPFISPLATYLDEPLTSEYLLGQLIALGHNVIVAEKSDKAELLRNKRIRRQNELLKTKSKEIAALRAGVVVDQKIKSTAEKYTKKSQETYDKAYTSLNNITDIYRRNKPAKPPGAIVKKMCLVAQKAEKLCARLDSKITQFIYKSPLIQEILL
jgi:hypothetical protein